MLIVHCRQQISIYAGNGLGRITYQPANVDENPWLHITSRTEVSSLITHGQHGTPCFRCIFVNEKFRIFIKISLKFVPDGGWIETFSMLMTLCEGNPPVTGAFPLQRPVTRSFDVFFALRLNKRLKKQLRRRWLQTPSYTLWHHRNGHDLLPVSWNNGSLLFVVYDIFIARFNNRLPRSVYSLLSYFFVLAFCTSWFMYTGGIHYPLNCDKSFFSIYQIKPEQNGRHFASDILKCIFSMTKLFIMIEISLKFVSEGLVDCKLSLVQAMAWRRTGEHPLFGPILV